MDTRELHERARAAKWERERANIGSYERWLARQQDTAIAHADKVATLQRLRRAVKEG